MALAEPVSDAGLALATVIQHLGLTSQAPLSDELVQHAVEACRVAGNKAFRAKDYRGEWAGAQGPAGLVAAAGRAAAGRSPRGRQAMHNRTLAVSLPCS